MPYFIITLPKTFVAMRNYHLNTLESKNSQKHFLNYLKFAGSVWLILLVSTSFKMIDFNANLNDPYVVTDLLDYAPGATAYITSGNFVTSNTVKFIIEHVITEGPDGIYGTADDVVEDTGGNGHDNWFVTDGSDDDGLANGVFETSWFVDPDDSAFARFRISACAVTAGIDGIFDTADDVFTGEVAMNTFTDAGVVPNQFVNGDANTNPQWISGNTSMKAEMVEGDFLPYRQEITGLTIGYTYYFGIAWDITEGSGGNGNLQAIDYIGTYNATIPNDPTHGTAWEGNNGPGDGNVLTGPVPTNTILVPSDPILSSPIGIVNINAPGGAYFFSSTQIAGSMSIWGGTFTEIGPYTNNGSLSLASNNGKIQSIEFAFTALQANVVVAWGGHIGMRSEWGSNARPTGSPYHMRAGTHNGPDPTNLGYTSPRTSTGDFRGVSGNGATQTTSNIGNQELQFGASEIVGLPSITIIKDAVPDGPQDFEFSPSSNLDLSNFFLDDDADASLPNFTQYFDLEIGETYTIEEINIPANWNISNSLCCQ